jgi:hypothetical protein
MKNTHFYMKSVIKSSYKAIVRARAEKLFQNWSRSGNKNLGSTTLSLTPPDFVNKD